MSELLGIQVGKSINHFGIQFLNNIEPNTTSNAVFSPLSLVTALYIVYLGTQKNSGNANELSNIFNYKGFNLESEGDIHKGLDAIHRHLSITTEESDPTDGQAGFVFKTANLLLNNAQMTGDLQYNFKQTLAKYYNVSLAEYRIVASDEQNLTRNDVLLIPDSQPSRLNVSNKKQLVDSINEWVSNKTSDKIKNILSEQALPELSELMCMIINAIHLKARWDIPYFDSSLTKEEYFFMEGDTNKKSMISFMQNSDLWLPFYDSLSEDNIKHDSSLSSVLSIGFKALQLPLKSNADDQATNLVIILPNNMTDLAKLQNALTLPLLEEIYNRSRVRNVDVKVPKFKFEFKSNGKSILQSMGIKKMFHDAMLTQMYNISLPMSFSDVIHKATIEVNEVGIEAAAATVSVVSFRMGRIYLEDDPQFYATHPFLFLVRHVKTNTPLFVGRVFKL